MRNDQPAAADDAPDQAWFETHAPLALARRDAAFLRARRAMWIEWVASGVIGLAGLFVFGWSAVEAALLLILGFWLGWLVDVVQWCLRRQSLGASYRDATDDMHVWHHVAVRRGRLRNLPAQSGHPSLVLGICVDAVAGGTASVLFAQGLARGGVDLLTGSTAANGLWIGALLCAFVGFVLALRNRLARRPGGGTPLPVFAVGQRGIGLLVLVFALTGVGGGFLAAGALVGCAYAFFIVMGLIELIWGVPALAADAQWLRGHLAAGGLAAGN